MLKNIYVLDSNKSKECKYETAEFALIRFCVSKAFSVCIWFVLRSY